DRRSPRLTSCCESHVQRRLQVPDSKLKGCRRSRLVPPRVASRCVLCGVASCCPEAFPEAPRPPLIWRPQVRGLHGTIQAACVVLQPWADAPSSSCPSRIQETARIPRSQYMWEILALSMSRYKWADYGDFGRTPEKELNRNSLKKSAFR